MLWLKAFHIIFMVTWFAGLFYLPRLYIYHLTVGDDAGHARFCVMERKLLVIMTIGAIATVVFGTALLAQMPALLDTGWMQIKLLCVLGLVGYHIWCWRLAVAFRERRNRYGDLWLRWFNEVPALLLIAIVVLAVVRPL